ncbi:MAG: phosphoadenylyl-sulfate reductase [Chlorobi bacterium]|nr:phosphoadenylyl-sulfate reductase [Chlorobiota bacterium]
MDKSKIEALNKKFEKAGTEDVLTYFIENFRSKIAFSSSLGLEDQVLTHMICNIDKSVKFFTLDTGRLFPETYRLIDETNKKYNIKIEMYFPDYKKVEKMVLENGLNLFYESVEKRKLCCRVRKLTQLPRAFNGLDAWMSGIRKDQTVTRFYSKMIEWDDDNNLLKINPLINWNEKEVWQYIKDNKIPYNSLHDKGFSSIGCQPCTRAVKPGEDKRAGRWWWEEPLNKECGLHQK